MSHAFRMGFSPKFNVFARLDFIIVYYAIAIHHRQRIPYQKFDDRPLFKLGVFWFVLILHSLEAIFFFFCVCEIEIISCSEIERQNLQTAAFDGPTGVLRSKRQRVRCCICWRNSRRLCEFSNRLWLDKKQVVNRVNVRNESW